MIKYQEGDWVIWTSQEGIDYINTILDAEFKNYLKQQKMKEQINQLVDTCFGNAKAAGWHKEVAPEVEGYLKCTQLMLMVSELGETMEGVRKGKMCEHLPNRKAEETELADLIIRACDYAGRWNLDLGGAVMDKLEYNKKRLDHKPENREKEGGKKF
jgi:NTP pyrophosphatase (non-canonical NTP hydrolase)